MYTSGTMFWRFRFCSFVWINLELKNNITGSVVRLYAEVETHMDLGFHELFSKQKCQNFSFQLLKCEDLFSFSFSYCCKLNIFGFGSVGQTKQDMKTSWMEFSWVAMMQNGETDNLPILDHEICKCFGSFISLTYLGKDKTPKTIFLSSYPNFLDVKYSV